MQPACHIAFSLNSFQNCPGVFNAADEAELCPRPENYAGNARAKRCPTFLKPGDVIIIAEA